MLQQRLTILFSLVCLIFSAQQGDGGKPKSDLFALLKPSAIQLPIPNVTKLRFQDSLTDAQKSGPWRFGFNHSTDLTMENSGTWTTLIDGGKIWRLTIICPEALTVNLTLDQVNIPQGNELYVYNPEKDFILGKFESHHLYEGNLGTELIPGNTAIIEYYIPSENVNLNNHLRIHTVTHGYRKATEFIEKAFGSSGSCNINVNCPEGVSWANQRNSVVMLVSGSNGFCTGALINNTSNDGKPYVLTANHCYSDPTTWIFRFNWQAANCATGSNPSFQSLSGAVLRSRRTPSDFCLVEITGGLVAGKIPSGYNPYFSGWDRSGIQPTRTVSIHHPSGDIKKISFDDAPALISQYANSTEPNCTWTVEWDRNTTTESGSSGSPLFDQNRRIIGQLWGGNASCNNLGASDFYGRIYSSWEPLGSNSTNQLKFWLDPTNSGAVFLNGLDPTFPNLDAGLIYTKDVVGSYCQNTVSPKVTISNAGSTVLTTATINYGYDGLLNQSLNWNGNLNQWQTVEITLPTATLSNGNHIFNAQITNPNGGVDLNMVDDTISSRFTLVTDGQIVNLLLDLDCFAAETSWELSNATNQILFSGAGYESNNPRLIDTNFCLNYGCYNFKIMDAFGDGMTDCSAANGGNGSYVLTHNGVIKAEILEANANFGSSNTQNFCLTLGQVELEMDNGILSYPNPASSSLMVTCSEGEIESFQLYNIAGELLYSQIVHQKSGLINVEPFASGVYFLYVTHNDFIWKKNIVISR